MQSRTRRIAVISLFIMGAGFVAMLPFQQHTWAKLLAGAFEAGLVGGLADWFAVTALFRHPLGIPIPHTALIPRNRGKMTEALVAMVQNNLLNKESIVDKLKEFQAGQRLLEMAEKSLQSAALRTSLKSMVLNWLSKPVDGLWAGLRPQISGYVRSRDWAGILLSFAGRKENLSKLTEGLLDYALEKGTRWVVTDDARRTMGRLAIQAISGLRMNGIMQFAVNAALNYFDEDQIGGAIQQALVIKLRELSIEEHPSRQAVLEAVYGEWARLAGSEETRSLWNSQLASMLGDWIDGDEPLQTLDNLRQNLHAKVRDGELLELHILPLLENAVARLRQDAKLVAAFNNTLQDMTVRILEANHSRIGGLVRENIEKMDNASLISLIEDKAGKDLQWIRVNGAVCGFFLGLLFTSLRLLV
ncbi:MAG: rane protein [Paenibacillaceae bacterium]|jgi:uncharacterized membrane-anchored protein YjiN (DUF445 family)|nr:rane protein [Paenibacillaceae bacterium]